MGLPAFTLDPEEFVSPEDYLRLEREAVHKHEYIAGKIIAMAGASYAHNRICANLTVEIGSQLRGKSCSLVGSDQRLQILNNRAFFYPDLTVVCGSPSSTRTKSRIHY